MFQIEPENYNKYSKNTVKSKDNQPLDSFKINANYSDPFLRSSYYGGSSIPDTIVNEKNKKAKEESKPTVNKVLWPNIIYSGKFNKSKIDYSTVIVIINGRTQIMSLGDVVDNVQLLSATADSIQVKYSEETKFIRK